MFLDLSLITESIHKVISKKFSGPKLILLKITLLYRIDLFGNKVDLAYIGLKLQQCMPVMLGQVEQ